MKPPIDLEAVRQERKLANRTTVENHLDFAAEYAIKTRVTLAEFLSMATRWWRKYKRETR